MQIHPTAIVHPKARLADDVEVGPFCLIGEHVTIGKGTRLLSHVMVDGWTEIGERNELHPFASIGGPPQHLGYKGEPTKVVIGDDNVLREYVTVNRATAQGGGVTSIANKNFLMAYVHVAHDCRLGSHLILANAATFAGHITIGDHAIIGGLTGIHQYVRVGAYAMVGGCCAVTQDVPPFMRAAGGYRASLYGLNSVGLRRHGFSGERIAILKKAYHLLFRSGHRIAEAVRLAKEEFKDQADVAQVLTFMEGTKRGISRSVSKEQEDEEEPA
ncbi:MAG TPA: acyl-ACP--UDP-N-acetylglucosamine O-acyltransferase [Nitrospiraceae bacterium]|nr:acyl-ACP--UDP-N-acetylglucosamine O-acyltransferase [Nitrospiraceae bacterium]